MRACVVEVLHIRHERMQQHQHPEDCGQLAEACASGDACGDFATAAPKWVLLEVDLPQEPEGSNAPVRSK